MNGKNIRHGTNPYQPGGTLSQGSYIVRKADSKLQEAILTNSMFPFVLAARQSGKSSVLVRTQSVLASPELKIAIVDLSKFSEIALRTYTSFVTTFVSEILKEIKSDDRIRAQVKQVEQDPLFLLEAIDVILENVTGRLVVCIDEIDTLQGRDFNDNFLGQIRSLFNSRTSNRTVNRIQFVLAGAASSENLISDLRQSPFNIGKGIELDDLSSDGARKLLSLGWAADTSGVDEALEMLLYWTSGSVFLCQDILYRSYETSREELDPSPLPRLIERSVAEVVSAAADTVHFQNIERQLKANKSLLKQWREWTQGKLPNAGSVVDLSIIGICRRDAAYRNRLYRAVFSHRGPLNLLVSPAPGFRYDVFLIHSPKDKAVAREVAERLEADGVRVWFDEWEVKPGDSIPAVTEEGLDQSRVLVFCMSASAFGSDWAQLEAGTFRFRDPLNQDRRFIPLRLDDAPLKGSLAQFRYINWLPQDRDQEYAKLLKASRPTEKPTKSDAPSVRTHGVETAVQLDYKPPIYAYAFSADGKQAFTGGNDHTVRLWDVEATRCLRVLQSHTERVRTLALSKDQCRILSGSGDNTVRVWNVETAACLSALAGHTDFVNSVVWSPDQGKAISASSDHTLRLWDVETGRCERVFEGHSRGVLSVAYNADQRHALSGSWDHTLRLWDVETGQCLRVLEGHTDAIWSVFWNAGQRLALSCSEDKTVRLWDVETGRCLRVFEGHTGGVWSAIWRDNLVLTGSRDNTVRLWDVETGRCLGVLEGHTNNVIGLAWGGDVSRVLSGDQGGGIRVWNLTEFVTETRARKTSTPTSLSAPDQVQYTNAKVLLVGESGAGKTGLSKRLALNDWQPSDSTVGAWATHWPLPVDSDDGVEREIWLWDFGGQADQRLIHQLYMDETALAVLVFDGQKEDLFETLGQWDRDLTRASRKEFAKLLVAGRIDASGLRVSPSQVEAFAEERGYPRFLETSAKLGTGCEELKQAILDGIRWENIPWRTSPLLFKRLKEEIIRLKDEDRVLMRFNELRDSLQLRMAGEAERFNDEELKAVIGLLAGPGAVWELKFGSWVLLQPERINAYAQAVIQTLREDRFERGCIPEEKVLAGDLKYESSAPRLLEDEERIVLLAMHQTLVERALCLREHTETGTLLVFPSYYRRERKELTGHPAVQVSYRFNGFLDDIYATLIVRLHHTQTIENDELWRYAADFKTLTGKQLGVKLIRLGEGAGELEVYFDPAIPVEENILFSKYIHEHVMQKGQGVVRLRHYVCPRPDCGTEIGNREVAMKRLNDWLEAQPTEVGRAKRSRRDSRSRDVPTMICVACENRFPLWDEMEQYFASPEAQQQVRELQEQSEIILDNESKERALVGEVISTVALAGQICREKTVSDHDIDLEIEFKDDNDEATGQMLFLQLKSGDAYLSERKRDGAQIFRIPKARHATYWREQPFPVLLVIRTSDGEVRWMEIRDYLKHASDNGKKAVKQIVFEGERFDVMSVRRWREKALKGEEGCS